MTSAGPTSEDALQQAIDRVWEAIPPLWNQMRANVRAIARERYQISVQQFRVLRHVRAGLRSVSELAEATQTSRPAASQCVEALVGKGLVTRRRSTGDRRYVEVEVTPAGADLLSAIFAENHRWMMGRLAALSPGELDQILAGMRALQQAFL